MTARPIPEGYRTVTPYLIVQGADRLIDFLKQAFDAEEIGLYQGSDGKVMHAAVRIGDSVVELGETGGEFSPRPGSIHLYVEDADAVYERAVRAGATTLKEPQDEFYGDREADVEDPFGNHWYIATHTRDVSREELDRHAQAAVNQ